MLHGLGAGRGLEAVDMPDCWVQWLVWQLPVAAYDGGSCAGLASRTAFMRS